MASTLIISAATSVMATSTLLLHSPKLTAWMNQLQRHLLLGQQEPLSQCRPVRQAQVPITRVTRDTEGVKIHLYRLRIRRIRPLMLHNVLLLAKLHRGTKRQQAKRNLLLGKFHQGTKRQQEKHNKNSQAQVNHNLVKLQAKYLVIHQA
jgi:hypothetical protein